MDNRSSQPHIVSPVIRRVVEERAGLWMFLAEGLGRLSAALERFSNALHERAMRDYAQATLKAGDIKSDQP